MLSDFSNRFDAESRNGAHLLGLLPGAVTKAEADLAELVNGLLFWESDLPQPTTLRTELKQWQRFWQKKDNVTAVSLKQCLQQANCDVFPNIAVLLKIACTLPVGSCEAVVLCVLCVLCLLVAVSGELKAFCATTWEKTEYQG